MSAIELVLKKFLEARYDGRIENLTFSFDYTYGIYTLNFDLTCNCDVGPNICTRIQAVLGIIDLSLWIMKYPELRLAIKSQTNLN